MLTQTSKEIIDGLEKLGISLTPDAKQLIIDKVYESTSLAYSEGKDGKNCHCGQTFCYFCNWY